MGIKLDIEYQQLLEMIRQLPLSLMREVKLELERLIEEKEASGEENNFRELLLHGPVMDDEQYQEFLANREYFNAWRKKSSA